MKMNVFEKIKSGEYKSVHERGVSDVWTFFRKIVNTRTRLVEPFVICAACEKIFKYGKGCSTSNLKKHLCYIEKKRQTGVEEPTTEVEIPTPVIEIPTAVVDIKPSVVSDATREEVLQNCVNFVVRDLRTCGTVNGDGFKALAQSLVEIGVKLGTNNFTINDILPHSTTINCRLQKLHADEVEVFVTGLRPIIEKGWCAGTVDLCTQQSNFLTLTVHYLDSNWLLHNRILFTISIGGCDEEGTDIKESAEFIISSIENKFEELKLGRDLHRKVNYTTDQDAIIKKALQHHNRINCIADVLNRILKQTFDNQTLLKRAPSIWGVITKCRSLVGHLKRSGGLTQLLATTVKEEFPSVPCCWYTEFDRLLSVRHNLKAIEEILAKSGESHRLIGMEKYCLDRVLAFLEPFKSAALVFDGCGEPSIHLVLLHMHILKEKLLKLRIAETHNEVQAIIGHCLDEVFDVEFQAHKMHKIAAFLWPEYKQLRYLNADERDQIYAIVKEQLQEIAKVDADEAAVATSPSEDEEMKAETDDDDDTDATCSEDNMLTKYRDVPMANNSQPQINVEMEFYKGSCFPVANISQWWEHHAKEFPLLAKLARRILCIPATTAASERSFSSPHRTVEDRRSHLEVDNLDAILYLNSQQKD